MFRTRFKYKNYALWRTSDNIVMLYVPKAILGTTSHALSFDNGESWCVAYDGKTIATNKTGTITEIIDFCVEINKENGYEE
ncbi:MAG: hypothetical protein IJE16_07470 [Ruminococcus sp.]|nr:hypothetical protein [Ruminococcus sp.]